MGMCVAISLPATVVDGSFLLRSALLFAGSGCLYLAGMVWNDYFDLEEDRRDRSFRPLPSGKVTLKTAVRIGLLLLLVGLVCTSLSGFHDRKWESAGAILGGLLVMAVLLYDARIKRTAAGPVGMAVCRFLNVLLGLTLVEMADLPWNARLHLAATVGVYIVGVTWFARTEEKRSKPESLRAAAAVILIAIMMALAVPIRAPAHPGSPLFPYLLVVFAFWIGLPVVRAIQKPVPERVQAGVKRCILGLVALDALLASVFVGTAGLLVLLLLPPALWLGKWVYST
jgi:4-hydroxybenzoate polyprenyltransferase